MKSCCVPTKRHWIMFHSTLSPQTGFFFFASDMLIGGGKHALGTSRCGDPRLRLGNVFSNIHSWPCLSLLHNMYSSFLTLKKISCCIRHLFSHWHLFPITFFSLWQLRIIHFIPIVNGSIIQLPLCLHSNIISLCLLSSVTSPFQYLSSLPGFSCVSVNHSTTQFSQ